jgi:hypothetical protein
LTSPFRKRQKRLRVVDVKEQAYAIGVRRAGV